MAWTRYSTPTSLNFKRPHLSFLHSRTACPRQDTGIKDVELSDMATLLCLDRPGVCTHLWAGGGLGGVDGSPEGCAQCWTPRLQGPTSQISHVHKQPLTL